MEKKTERKVTVIQLSEEEKGRRAHIKAKANMVLQDFRFYTNIRLRKAIEEIDKDTAFKKYMGATAYAFFSRLKNSREAMHMFIFEANHAALRMPLDTDEIQDVIYKWAELHRIEKELESAIKFYDVCGPNVLQEITEKAIVILEGRVQIKDTTLFKGVDVPARKKSYIPDSD